MNEPVGCAVKGIERRLLRAGARHPSVDQERAAMAQNPGQCQACSRGRRVRYLWRQFRARRGSRMEAEELPKLSLATSGVAARCGRSTRRHGRETMDRPDVG